MKKVICIIAGILMTLSIIIGIIDFVNYRNGSNLALSCTGAEGDKRQSCETKNEVMDLVIETTYQIEWMMAFGYAGIFLLIMLSQIEAKSKKK